MNLQIIWSLHDCDIVIRNILNDFKETEFEDLHWLVAASTIDSAIEVYWESVYENKD